MLRFAAIGVASTVGYVLLYLLLRGSVGPQGANVVALLVPAVANTGANRRLTFGITGTRHAARSQVEGLIVIGLGLALTSGALAVLGAVTHAPGRGAEITVLVLPNLVATVLRFLAYRSWVFSPRRHGAHPVTAAAEEVAPAPTG